MSFLGATALQLHVRGRGGEGQRVRGIQDGGGGRRGPGICSNFETRFAAATREQGGGEERWEGCSQTSFRTSYAAGLSASTLPWSWQRCRSGLSLPSFTHATLHPTHPHRFSPHFLCNRPLSFYLAMVLAALCIRAVTTGRWEVITHSHTFSLTP